jgi:Mor family transcriptional regulator
MTDMTTEDALDLLEREVVALAQFHKLQQASLMGQMFRKRVAEQLGGRLVYISKDARAAQAERNAKICREFTGRNHAELAKKHELTERQVRKIVRLCAFHSARE